MPVRKKADKGSKSSKKSKDEQAAVQEDVTSTEPNENETPADALRRMGIVTTFALSSKSIHRNVRDINVSNLTVTFHGTPLVEDAELTLNYGNRYGFIGRNGCGKSTFMKVIGARSFPIPDGIDIFHLKEEIEASDMTAKEAVMSVDEERARLEAEADELNDLMALEEGGENADDTMERLNQVYERLEELDAATAEARASKILTGLGFTVAKQNKKTKEFSGGWRMRIALARALFIQPTLLLLDEPTNHLDMEAVVWLEDYLSKWNKILFMVSHSQDFMNNVCTHIVHLSKRQLTYYSGNYDQFVKTRTEKEEEQEKRYKSEQDQIKHMKNYVAKFGQGNAKMAKQAQSKEKVLDKMLKSGLTEKVEAEKALDFNFPNPQHLAPPVLQCNDITFGYPGCEILYSNVDFGIDLDSRVALVGPNGAGKSTLLKIMSGDLVPVSGAVRPHAHLRISKFSQHFLDVLDLTVSPLDYFMALWPDLSKQDGRKFLGRFGISGSVQTQVIGQLSDGQKSRVVLAKMAKENPHILFLDEPTNHLDMESIDSLAKAINAFEGGMVLVSHDMRLISQVAKEIWLCDNRTVAKYVGEIQDFKMHLRHQMQLDSEAAETGKTRKKAPALKVEPLVQRKLPSEGGGIAKSEFPALTVAPPLPNPPPMKKTTADEDDDKVRQARLELAELAIARQRARQAEEAMTKNNDAASVTTKATETSAGEGEPTEEELAERMKAEEKALAKARRKAEKEAAEVLRKREEEERKQRKEEKLREIEEAKRVVEEQQKAMDEFRAAKAIKEAKLKAAEEAEAVAQAEAAAKRKAEREIRKREKAAQRAAEIEAARLAAEKAVIDDVWTQQQQETFETALLEFTSSMDKWDRWTKVAAAVGDKTKNQCIMRYRYLKELIAKKKQQGSS